MELSSSCWDFVDKKLTQMAFVVVQVASRFRVSQKNLFRTHDAVSVFIFTCLFSIKSVKN